MLARFNFFSQSLMKQTNVTMILPSWDAMDRFKGKAESYLPGTKFQTLYLYHGGTGDDSDYINFSNIIRYANDNKIAVIMPAGYNSGYENDVPEKLPWQAKYWDYIFEELPKVCAAMFPISTKPEDTFVAGLSMGAIATAKWVAYGPERINTALMMSGGGMDVDKIMAIASQYGNGSTDFEIDFEELEDKGIKLIDSENESYQQLKRNIEEGKKIPKVLMTCGGNDFIRSFAIGSKDILEKYGYDVTYEEVPGYTHEWDFWDLSLRKALYEWLPIRHDVILADEN
ncbi:alpha/beta hydrolase fold domain-containing protein [Clostridium sp. D2Q-14]|uniref:alpha/beta hydrolase n=1 Tax=Anaeromonas gelatinilytica TaxID=2683194 RepID=UPI00193C8575|nr:alpha/beta hydrolase-fold protein [Anaeromonas gelatinilytica]MBS4534891.1 alpha/beta hydrolase fold domain-containing protein [Anaeromonas gelatinilytica]